MKFVLLLCACAAVSSASVLSLEERNSHADNKRFLASVANFFHHAAETVRDGVVDAAHSVAGAAETAAHAVAGAAETAAHSVVGAAETAAHSVVGAAETAAHSVAGAAETAAHAVAGAAETAAHAVAGAAETAVDKIGDAAHTVGDALTNAAHKVSDFTSEASKILAPIMDQVASTVRPIAKEVLDAAVAQLIQHAPDILATLGEMGVQELATSILTSAVGRRDISHLDALKEMFSQLVEQGINSTVSDVHKVVSAVDKFNAGLKAEVEKLQQALKQGDDVEEVVRRFFLNTLSAVQPLIDANAFAMDVNRFDKIIPDAIRLFKDKLHGALSRAVQKRDAEQDVVGSSQRGHQHIGQLVSNLEHLAQRLLAPTVNNVKHIASTLLDQTSSVTSDLMTKAMTLLAPYQRQLGSVFQQVQALAAPFHLSNA